MRCWVAANKVNLFFTVTSALLNRVTEGKFKLFVVNVQMSFRTSTISVATTDGDKKRTINVRYPVMSDGPEPVNGTQVTCGR